MAARSLAMADALSVTEVAKLEDLEIVIAGGLQSFVDVGQALMQIRDGRLYRIQFGTFEDYCQDRWSFGRSYVNKIIAASDAVSSLGTNVPKPSSEFQARPLTRLPAEEQPAAWREAVETAPNGKVTAKHVESVVARKLEAPTDGSVTLQTCGDSDGRQSTQVDESMSADVLRDDLCAVIDRHKRRWAHGKEAFVSACSEAAKYSKSLWR
jgi:hypothetical protein